MTRRYLAFVGAVGLFGCTLQGEDYSQAATSAAEDAVKYDDVQQALSALPSVEVLEVGAAGVPTFVRGVLGKLDRPATKLAVHSQDFRENLERIAPAFRLAASDLEHLRTFVDQFGASHVRLRQKKNGLRVVGGELIVHVDTEGLIYAANGRAREGVSLSPFPSVDAAAALRAAREASREVSELRADAPELVYFTGEDGAMALAWEIIVTGERAEMPVRDRVYVSARSGELLARHPTIHSAKQRKLHTALNKSSLPGTLVRTEGQADAADEIVNINYERLGTTYDCYKTLFGRDSYDNEGAALVSTVRYKTKYVNAFWDGRQMVYGDGDGVTADNLAKSMDVTAHELTHAVTDHSADLVYSGQSGGLNESMSDVFANVCEAFRDGAVSANTWKVGEDIWTPGTPGDALRYMDDPRKDGDSLDTFADYTSGTDVHYSSGIGNLAFYLASQGGTHPRNRTNVVVPGIGITKAGQIWYRALTAYMQSNTNFAGARTTTVQAAVDLYGQAEGNAVASAWAAVGVGTPPSGGGGGGGSDGGAGGGGGSDGGTPDGGSSEVVLKNGSPVIGLAGAEGSKRYFVLDVPAGQSSLGFVMTGDSGDADLYVKRGERPTTSSYDCRPYTSTSAESCNFTNPSAGRWYVMVLAYSDYDGLSVKGTYAAAPAQVEALKNGVPVKDVSGAAASERTWRVTVPAGTAKLTVAISPQSGASGDADLYVRRGSAPTTSDFDCRPFKSGSNESCTLTSAAGDYYVVVRGYSAFTGVTLKASY